MTLVCEGLRPMDLVDLVHPILEVDTYRSKMGEDRDVCVVTFKVSDRAPAKDLMEFIEKGFDFVLDSDVSSGETQLGEYFVFVEMSRTPKLTEQIKEIISGVRRLTGITEWEFKYHKNSTLHEFSEETIKKIVPLSANAYDGLLQRVKTDEVKKFFGKTLMDDLTLDGDIITIHKPYNQKIKLQMIKDGESSSIFETIDGAVAIDSDAMSEIFWLTKVLGDYNINKVNDSFVFEYKDRAMVLKRV